MVDYDAQIADDVWDRPSIETKEEFRAAIAKALEAARLESVRECAKLVCCLCSGARPSRYQQTPEAFRRTYQHFTEDRRGWAWCDAARIYARWPAAAPAPDQAPEQER